MENPQQGKMNIVVLGFDSVDIEIPGYSFDELEYTTVNDGFQLAQALEALCIKSGIESNVTYLLGKNLPADIQAFFNDNPDRSYLSPTKSNLENVINSTSANKNDITVFFFATHGFVTSVPNIDYGTDLSSHGYFIVLDDNDFQKGYLYSYADFLDKISYINGKKLTILDICNGGGMIENGNVSINENAYEEESLFDLLFNDELVPNYDSNSFVLSATSYNEGAGENSSINHGYFTYFLLQGLGWDEENQCLSGVSPAQNGKIITVSDLAKYCLDDGRLSQTACCSGSSEDLVLFSF